MAQLGQRRQCKLHKTDPITTERPTTSDKILASTIKIPTKSTAEKQNCQKIHKNLLMSQVGNISVMNRGTEEDVLAKNEMVRFRYGAMHKRFDKFDFD